VTNYARMYRFGIAPWERYGTVAAASIANPGATLLLLSFGPSRWRSLVGGTSQEEIETAFAGWEMLAVEPAETAGLGWPMSKTAPQWYRLRRPA